MNERIGDWGCCFTGRKYWPADPQPEDIDIMDIAHALANQCRFGGHVREFYSVAQHSVHVADFVSSHRPADALWALLHDASEAYIVDIPRPLKYAPGMEGYLNLERRMMEAVCSRFGLFPEMPPSVRVADEVLLATEARDLMPDHGEAGVPKWGLTHKPLAFTLSVWSPTKARTLFLARFQELTQTTAAA